MKSTKIMQSFIMSFSVLLVTFMTVGCGSGNTNQEIALKEEIRQLKQEVTTLKENVSNTTSNQSNVTNSNQESEVNTKASDIPADTGQGVTNHGNPDTIESLTKEVDRVIEQVSSAVPSGKSEEDRTDFFAYKDKLNEVEDRVDAYDDYIEAEYRQDRLSFEEYRKLERKQEKLEDRLDTVEDKLEQNFKMDA